MSTTTFKKELIALMLKWSESDVYVNPHLISGICRTLEDTGTEVDDKLWDWCEDNWYR